MLLLLILVGCRRYEQSPEADTAAEQTTAAETSYIEYIMSNTKNYPHLTKDEFISAAEGKTELTFHDLPAEKACVLASDMSYEYFIIEDKFLLIIGDESMFAESNHQADTEGYCCILGYFENGVLSDSITTVSRFADFIRLYTD